MVAGDAAAMVNALHWEGTNMAMVAGRIAGETGRVSTFKRGFYYRDAYRNIRSD